jgi:hypothetical protein
MFFQFNGFWKTGAINARKHFVFFTASPVRACYGKEFKVFDVII